MTDKIFEIEYRPGGEVILRLKMQGLPFVPEATRAHLKTAGKEVLLAFRPWLDKAIEQVEQAETAKEKKRTKIEVK